MKKLIYASLALLIFACNSDDNSDNATDTEPPVVTLTGESIRFVAENESYEDDGATATDEVDGDLTSSIMTMSNVDTSTVGIYSVTHTASDAAGNTHSASRKVYVEPNLPAGKYLYRSPRATLPGTANIYVWLCHSNYQYYEAGPPSGSPLIETVDNQIDPLPGVIVTFANIADLSTERDKSDGSSNLENYVTTAYKNFNQFFLGYQFNENQDYSHWDVSNVTTMSSMFKNSNFDSAVGASGIGVWKVDNVTNMNSMFEGVTAMSTVDLSSWNVKNVTDCDGFWFNVPDWAANHRPVFNNVSCN